MEEGIHKSLHCILSLLLLFPYVRSQPILCEPCSCHHGNWTVSLNCTQDGFQNLNWEDLPSIETWATFSNQQNFGFHQFPARWRNMTTMLTVSHSTIDDLDLSGFYVLKTLTVQSVKILSQEEFNLAPLSLQKLYLKDAGIDKFSLPFEHPLITLDLSYNALDTIPVAVNLRNLSLRHNALVTIKSSQCSPMTYLTYLDLSENKLTNLGENALNCIIEAASSGTPHLTLNFSRNQIRSIHPRAFSSLLIVKIDLSNNKLRSIDPALLDWQGLTYVDVQWNPWQCDCDSQWMIDELVPWLYNSTPSLLYYFRCSNPKRFHDKPLVFWLHRSSDVFCGGPKAYYLTSMDGESVYEIWTESLIACIVLGIIIIGLTISIIVVCCLPKKKSTKVTTRSLQSTRYSLVGLVSDEEKF